MLRTTRWMTGVLAAALCIGPAAAQVGSTSRGNEGTYSTGNGSDPTRSNTNPSTAPTTHDQTGRGDRDMTSGGTGSARDTTSGTTSSEKSGSLATEDTRSLAKLHQGNQDEIQAGTMMEKQAQSSKVKDFAKKMVNDHTKLDKDLTEYAQKHGVDLTSSTAAAGEHSEHARQLSDLQGMTGTQADRTYMDMMVQDHTKDVSDVRAAHDRAKAEGNKDLASLLDKTRSKMEDHLKDAQKIQRDMGSRQARNPANQ